MATLELWTQSVAATWPPSLSFYDKRLELLHSFQDDGVLHAFRNQEGETGALLGDRDHQVDLRPNGLSLKLLRPKADVERVKRAASAIVDSVKPSRVTGVRVGLQYLAPLTADYESSLSRSALAFLGLDEGEVEKNSTSSLEGWDWAVLLDGQSDRADAGFQVEFGIVDASEIPERLARENSRIETLDESPSSDHWEDADFPEVAFFADWTWNGSILDDLTPFDGIMELWSYAIEDAEQLLGHVVSRIEESSAAAVTATKKGENP